MSTWCADCEACTPRTQGCRYVFPTAGVEHICCYCESMNIDGSVVYYCCQCGQRLSNACVICEGNNVWHKPEAG